MSTITVGGQSLETAVPADLNDRLVKATGASIADHVQILTNRGVTPYQVARSLQPLLVTPMKLPALTKLVAVSDVRALRLDVAKLLQSVAAPIPAAQAPAPAQEEANGDPA